MYDRISSEGQVCETISDDCISCRYSVAMTNRFTNSMILLPRCLCDVCKFMLAQHYFSSRRRYYQLLMRSDTRVRISTSSEVFRHETSNMVSRSTKKSNDTEAIYTLFTLLKLVHTSEARNS